MVTISIEEVLAIEKKLIEINTTKLEDIIFLHRGGRKVGWVVLRMDREKVQEYLKERSMYLMITSGAYKEFIKEAG